MKLASVSFEQFMKDVDNAVWDQVGMSVHDLPDFDFWGAYESGKTAVSTARKVVKSAGGDF